MQSRELQELTRTLLGVDETKSSASALTAWEQVPLVGQIPHVEVQWTVEGIVPAGGLTLMAGESGSYKTWLALVLAREVARGGEFIGRKCVQTDVLYLDRENPDSLLSARATVLGLRSLANMRLWGGWHLGGPPVIGDDALFALARERRPLIIFDSFIRFHQQEENSATEMALIMSELRRLAHTGASVVVLHHKPKSDSSQYRGSSDIRAAVDVAYAISSDADSGSPRIRFACFKNRFAAEISLMLTPMLDPPNGTFVLDNSPAPDNDALAERLLEIISAHPGISQGELVQQFGMRKARALTLLRDDRELRWRTEVGPRGTICYFPALNGGSNRFDFDGKKLVPSSAL